METNSNNAYILFIKQKSEQRQDGKYSKAY